MIISVKTTGLLGKYLPEGSQRNRGDVDLPDGSTVQDLLNTLTIPDDGRCYVSLNDTMLQAEAFETTVLAASDKIILMTPITAG